MEKVKPRKSDRSVLWISLVTILVVFVNSLFLLLSTSTSKAIRLLEGQVTQLKQEERIVKASEQLYEDYQDEIQIVSSVFPNEVTIPQFIQSLEGLIRPYSDSYAVRFNSLTPLAEQERLFLILTITMHTDLARLYDLLEQLETLPYMTHITSMNVKTPDGFSGIAEVNVTLKVYVQNPFTPA
jgi:predicted PurR-regulated permease PerM